MRITAYVFRFIAKSRAKRRVNFDKRRPPPMSELRPLIAEAMPEQEELTRASAYWAKNAQADHYRRELNCRREGEPFPSDSKLSGLNPKLDANGILRVIGRIINASAAYEQIIIPPRSRLAWLLLDKAHRETMHGTSQQMLAYMRTGFWMTRLRAEIRTFVSRCAKCARYRAKPIEQLMGDLPADRVRPARPFERTGVDFAGPFEIRQPRGRPPRVPSQPSANTTTAKGYVAVFVCLVTRAVHLEPVMGLTSEAFLAAYRRFVSRRGHVEHLYSDNGRNFVGANAELIAAGNSWREANTLEFVQARGTRWHFITPAAPFEGGIWEGAIKSMKYHLRRVMGQQRFTFEVLATLLCEIEACLNSRPICAMSDDPTDARVLTPAHFLISEELVLPIPVPRSEPPRTTRDLWQLQQHLAQSFWKPWQQDYLHSLQQRRKWKKECENIRPGQLVILKNELLPPARWAMGRIIATHPGADGLVRKATILIDGAEYIRPVRKMVIVPTDEDLAYWR